ncbi:MAG: substrate-binding domain-containing protein [Granulosicoccus sp.]
MFFFGSTRVALVLVLIGIHVGASALADSRSILVQSTTSTANSGLYSYLLPDFEATTGIQVNVVAVGTGQAIKNAKNCDADVLLVHAQSAEEQFVLDGFGVERFDLMYNDFVVVGPGNDPAGIKGLVSIKDALTKIAQNQSLFASRGDDSGTHKKEMKLWEIAGVDTDAYSGEWYRSTGSGMGATLNTGVGLGAYVMTDRATWIKFRNKSDYLIAVEGDKALFNQYGVVSVNKQKCPMANSVDGQVLVDWLLSAKGQNMIANYQVDGQQLFFPNGAANPR